jgi:GDP-L-fucose synthase
VKILVTGATGMVGKNILENKDFQNFEILAPDRKELDLCRAENVLSYIQKSQPDLIIHTAARVGGIQDNIANPVAYLTENLDINRNLIMASYRAGVKKMINLGSSCMYPRDAKNPLSEDLILKGELEPTNEGYALAKITAQRLCAYIKIENPSFNYKTLIPCNLYGRHDKFDPQHSHLVPAVIKKLHEAKIQKKTEVDIWGDGLARREFMYSADLAECLYRAVGDFELMPDVMNVGLGHDYSVNEYYQAAADVIGFSGKFKHDLSKPVGMKQKLTDVSLATKWGWKSKTSLFEGLEQSYRYFLSLQK